MAHKSEECNCALNKIKSESGDYPTIIECRVINNTKNIAAGEELVVYREKVVAKVVEKSKAVNNMYKRMRHHTPNVQTENTLCYTPAYLPTSLKPYLHSTCLSTQ